MKTTVRFVLRNTILLAALLLLGTASPSQAQIRTSFTFDRGSSQRQIIVVPTYIYRTRFFANPSVLENWVVGLRTAKGVTSRTYQVNNSRDAILRARREFPNASLIGVKKSYR